MQHRKDRDTLSTYQEKRWAEEEKVRASRVRRGFKGLWDKLTLKYWKIREKNEKEAWQCFVRDRDERQELFEFQLEQRQRLQEKIDALRVRQDAELGKLSRDLSRVTSKGDDEEEIPEALRREAKLADLGPKRPVSLAKKHPKRRAASNEKMPDTDPEH